ncbi:YbhB/YbcL family Raf kinase inhibitor-like protein [Archaeoglobus veneficus]|uniref:YbhB YbcL family protein n=1 Tax=Archaeoglobus veneficus (strain DSM 11195 / SNP6) TaxID=693661 RepID=F2KQY7_ARCVS|nr:YbhB/YbcL family Raf kinase inhibitor-like protein [Archaeoglobus veneficus]AEA47793.1 YbhB YbcL family protein [Archaeoglobus veneficus SNP6]
MKRLIFVLLAALILAGCAAEEEKAVNEKVVETEGDKVEKEFTVKLPFKTFPEKYTCNGEDVSPPIAIEGVSKEAKSIAIIMDDPDAPLGTFTHWVIWNIPANITSIPESIPPEPVVKEPISAVQGKNDFGRIGYGGPCPPSGVHNYKIKVYILDTFLNLDPGATKEELENAMKGHILQYAVVTASYGR